LYSKNLKFLSKWQVGLNGKIQKEFKFESEIPLN
jgi:hypothetical protein